MSGYDDATPEVQAATDAMMAEVQQSALDYAKLAAIQVGMHIDEHDLQMIRIGAQAGLAATIGYLTQRDMLRGVQD